MNIYTIGYGNADNELFFSTLEAAGIEVLVDVRFKPFSRWAPWTNRKALQSRCQADGMKYKWAGQTLGGNRDEFPRESLDFLGCVAEKWKTVVMCAEADPDKCHRTAVVECLPEVQVTNLRCFPMVAKKANPNQAQLF